MRMRKLTAIALLLLVQACTSRSVQPAVEDNTGNNQGARHPASPAATIDESPSVPVVLDEQTLKKTYALDTKNMRYKFSYLSTQSENDIKFENGKARIEFKNLTHGVKGDLSLTLLEGSTAKLYGESKDLVLNKGPNNIHLVMKPVQAGSTATELVVSVELDQPTSGGGTNPPVNPPPSNPPPTPPTGGSTPPTGGGTPPVTPTNPPPTTGGVDPTATSFARDIKPMFEAHCTECHHSGAQNPDLTSRKVAEAGLEQIIARIEGSSRPMPPPPRDKVSQNELEKLRSWKMQGFRP